ncbi:MAG: putative endoribonuclease [Conexibacter sp.]|nr:putative endoribonuclease [Conexibacter sp.]
MTAPRFASPDRLPGPAGYSHVVSIPSDRTLVWTSGQVGLTADGIAPRDVGAQARLAFEHVGEALAAGGATWADVVKLTLYVTDLDDLPAIRAARDELVDVAAPPTSSLVQVAGLFRPDLFVEVEAVAAVAG